MSELDRLGRVSGVGRDDIEGLGALDESQYAALRTAFEHARDLRKRELDEAIDQGLHVLPRMARPIARRMLFE